MAVNLVGKVTQVMGPVVDVQFAGDRRLTFRVISVDQKPTYHGWVWLTGYVINHSGEAAERRETQGGATVTFGDGVPAQRDLM